MSETMGSSADTEPRDGSAQGGPEHGGPEREGPVVVAVDGSPGSDAARRWAVADAVRRSAPLRIVSVVPPATSEVVAPVGLPVAVVDAEAARQPYQDLLDDALEAAVAAAPGTAVETVLADGSPADAIIDAAADAALLVVGRSGRNQALAVILGSISRAVLHHAAVPVVVVPADATAARHQTIVVGVDGSPGSDAALAWAVAEASRSGASLHIVHAWRYPYLGVRAGAGELVPLIHEDAQHVLDDAVARARELVGRSDVDIFGHLEEHVESAGLLEVAERVSADLVVVGSRGRGGFKSLLLGSVSTVVATHAPCAVVVIRPAKR
jgi:nucleotide-binding universal stress UspA family protein